MQVTATTAATIRAIGPEDLDALVQFYAGLSPESLEARFHGACAGLPAGAASAFCGPDHEHRQGLVAEGTGADGRPTIVGHLCVEPVGESAPGDAEVAVAVADAWQGQGVGRALLGAAIEWAGAHGIDRLLASIRWGNAAMLGLIRSTGRPLAFGPPNVGTMEVVIDLRRGALLDAA